MSDHYFAYYEHLAKLATIANKQTMFLAHLLYKMEWDKETKVNIVVLATKTKKEIMKKVSPELAENKLLLSADQYLHKLKKANFIKNIDSGVWVINPSCFGQYKHAKKKYRDEKTKIFMRLEYNAKGLDNFFSGDNEKVCK